MNNKNNRVPILSRQPIFRKDRQVYAYSFSVICPRESKSEEECFSELISMQDSINLLSDLSGKKPVKISVSDKALTDLTDLDVPKERLIIDVDSTNAGEHTLKQSLQQLKNSGFMLSTNYTNSPKSSDKYSAFDIVSIDFRKLLKMQENNEKTASSLDSKQLLALSVETGSDLDSAVESGSTYFQGNFFIRPSVKALDSIPVNKINQLEILKLINDSSIDFDRIEDVLKRDVSLTYKLLTFINSSSFGVKREINSISHALNLLGEKEVRKWLSIAVMGNMIMDKPQELMHYTLTRSMFNRNLACAVGRENPDEYFLMGMFSLIDAFVDRPATELLETIPINPEVKAAILGEENIYSEILNLTENYEAAEWHYVQQEVEQLGTTIETVATNYYEALKWSDRI